MLGMIGQPWVVDFRHFRMGRQKLGKRLGVGAGARHAQGQRFRADGKVMRRLG